MVIKAVVAEHDPDVQRTIRAALESAQFAVTTASDGWDALERIAATRPDVVLLDWAMPKMDGLETILHLKIDPATRNIPVIFLTPRSHEAEVRHGIALGGVGSIPKPLDVATLVPAVREFLKLAGPEKAG
jgi:CheY-like chemotaxis protein